MGYSRHRAERSGLQDSLQGIVTSLSHPELKRRVRIGDTYPHHPIEKAIALIGVKYFRVTRVVVSHSSATNPFTTWLTKILRSP